MSQPPAVITLTNIIKSLKKLPENEYESDQCLDYLKKIDNSFNEEKSRRQDIAKSMVDHQYTEIALKCLRFYTRKSLFENEQTWPCAFYLLRSIWNYSDVNADIASGSVGFIPILLDFLTNECLLSSDEEDEKLYKLSLNIMNNIAHQPETKVVFQQYQASKILKNLTPNIDSEHLKVLIYLILAQIVNENEFDKLNDPSSEVIESISTYLRESLKKERRYKGISTSEYMECMAKLAVTKDNKPKIIETGILSVFKTILNNPNVSEDQNNTLTCIWNLCFEEKICEAIKKDKELIQLITSIKNSSSSEEMQRKAAGILFCLNDLLKKSDLPSQNRKPQEPGNSSKSGHVMISYNYGSRDMCLKIREELKAKGIQVWIDVEQIYGSTLASMAEAVENSSVFLMCVSEKYYQSPNCRLEAEYAVRLQKPIIPLIMQSDYMPLGWLGIIIGGKIYYKFAGTKLSFEQTFANMLKEVNRYYVDDSLITKLKTRQPTTNSSYNSNNTINTSSNFNTLLNTYNNNLTGSSFNENSKLNISSNSQPSSKISLTNKQNASDWSSKEVKLWLNSLNLSAWIVDSEVFENINGQMLKELDEIKKNAPDFFYNLIKCKLTKNNNNANKSRSNSTSSANEEVFSLSDLLKISSEMSSLFKLSK